MERGTSRAVEKVGVTRVKVGVEVSNVGDKEEMITPQKIIAPWVKGGLSM